MDIELIKGLIIFSLSLLSTFFGINVIVRCKGKLRVAVIFLTSTLFLFVLFQVGKILQMYNMLSESLAIYVLQFISVIFILYSLINLNSLILEVKSYKRRK